MLKTPEELRAMTLDLSVEVWTLAALAALFESGLAAELREPRTVDELAAACPGLTRGQVERCVEVAVATGVAGREGERYRLAAAALPFAVALGRNVLAGDLRTNLMQALAFVDSARGAAPTAGWRHTDRAVLQSQGDASAMLAPMMKMRIVPQLEDLAARLEAPGARFLDVGAGVAALSIALCCVFPNLSVVGVDDYDVPLAVAQDNIARAGLADRIEMRLAGIEALADCGAFECAWVPSFFIARHPLQEAAARIRAALRPGGWVLLGTGPAPDEPRRASVWSLINELWGGVELSAADAETLLSGAGLTSVRTLPGPSWAPRMVVGRAP